MLDSFIQNSGPLWILAALGKLEHSPEKEKVTVVMDYVVALETNYCSAM